MKINLLLKNGMVIDPSLGMMKRASVAICGRKIVRYQEGDEIDQEIDASECIVTPGLIDFHTHVFPLSTDFGIWADSTFLPQGVTSVVDAGSAGVINFENFLKSSVSFNQMRVFGLVNVSPFGISTLKFHEEVNPKYYDEQKIFELNEKYPGKIIGLKCRQSEDVVGRHGLNPLKETVKIADKLKLPVVVHTTQPYGSMDSLADLLRPGDVLCHCFHGKGNTIIDNNGSITPGILNAKKRGVVFDTADGKSHFSFSVANSAFKNNFFPDVISSDLTTLSLYKSYSFALPFNLSKYLNLGLELSEAIASCTSRPAKFLGMAGQIGTLTPGAIADISVFRLIKNRTRFTDALGVHFFGEQLLLPQLTVLDGRIVFRQLNFDTV